MKQYLELIQDVVTNGIPSEDRTGVGTRSVFGRMMRFNLSEGFPLVTTKKMFWKGAVIELLWFLRGDTNTKFLEDNGVTFWREWQTESGEIGPMYGKQLRRWSTWTENNDPYSRQNWDYWEIDQIKELVLNLKFNANSRRHVITTWNPADLPIEQVSAQDNVLRGNMALAPCHGVDTQFYVRNGVISCFTFQRSADVFLGLPVNIASYALLTHMLAQQCGYEVGELIYTTGDTHLYNSHVEQANLQLARSPMNLPKLVLNKAKSIFGYRYEDFKLVGYDPYPTIKGEVAV